MPDTSRSGRARAVDAHEIAIGVEPNMSMPADDYRKYRGECPIGCRIGPLSRSNVMAVKAVDSE